MVIATYLFNQIAVLSLTVAFVARVGKKHSGKRLLQSLLATLILAVFLQMLTPVFSYEGNSIRLFFESLLCLWVVTAFVRTLNAAAVGNTLLLIAFFGLNMQFDYLATSDSYTNSPQRRRDVVRIMSISAARLGRAAPPPVTISTVSTTWLTGLYAVRPPEGGGHRH